VELSFFNFFFFICRIFAYSYFCLLVLSYYAVNRGEYIFPPAEANSSPSPKSHSWILWGNFEGRKKTGKGKEGGERKGIKGTEGTGKDPRNDYGLVSQCKLASWCLADCYSNGDRCRFVGQLMKLAERLTSKFVQKPRQ